MFKDFYSSSTGPSEKYIIPEELSLRILIKRIQLSFRCIFFYHNFGFQLFISQFLVRGTKIYKIIH